MNVTAYLADLPLVHPNLVWYDIGLAVVAVFTNLRRKPPFKFDLSIVEVPGYHDDVLRLLIDAGEISTTQVDRLRRTYEPARLVELAAIAIAGLGLYHAGGHKIHDVSLRGSAADYIVDEEDYLLEIAGRSRRKDFECAWQQKWQRLTETVAGGFYVCVAEFETPTGRLAFQD
jgi:hypothetical protein